MATKNFTVNAVDEESGSSIDALITNKTLIIDQYTGDADDISYDEQMVEDENKKTLLENAHDIKDVFDFYKPQVTVEFTTADNGIETETISFTELRDFEAKGGNGQLIERSKFLSNAKSEIDNTAKIRKQIEQNRKLGQILKDPKGREEFKTYLELLLNELEEK